MPDHAIISVIMIAHFLKGENNYALAA